MLRLWLCAVLCSTALLCTAAPVEESLQESLQQQEDDDTLLLLVPSVPAGRQGVEEKHQEVEYDLIAIPGEVLRREVRQTGHNYGPFEQSLEDAIRKKSLVNAANQHGPLNPHDLNTDTDASYHGNSVVQTLLDSAKENADHSLDDNQHDKRSFFGNNNNNDNSGEGFLIGDFASSSSSSSSNNKGSTTTTTTTSNNNNGGGVKDVLRTVGNVISTGSTIVRGVERVVNKFSGGGSSTSSSSSGGEEQGGALGRTLKKIIRTKLSLVGVGGGSSGRTTGGSGSTSAGNVLGNVGQAIAIGSTVVGGLSTVINKLNRNQGSSGGGGGNGPLAGIAELPGNIVEGIRNLKEGAGGGGGVREGIKSFTTAATDGLRFVGRLSSSILRILLQIPAIKARVITEAVQAATPLKTTISDVIGENADDMRSIIESGSEMIRDAMDILVNIVSQVLAFHGRVLAKFGSSSMDASSNIFDGGLRVGGAIVQTAGDVASAVGRGVGDVVQVVSEADVPPLPQLPQLPQLPNLGNLFGGGNKGSSSSSSSSSTVITSSTNYDDNNTPFDLFGGRRRR